MEEADLLCDRILIMNRGKIVIEGTQDELKRKVGEKVVVITSSPGMYEALKNEVGSLEKVSSCSENSKGLKITHTDELPLQEVFEIFKSHGEKIINVGSSSPSLEDVFIHASGEEWH